MPDARRGKKSLRSKRGRKDKTTLDNDNEPEGDVIFGRNGDAYIRLDKISAPGNIISPHMAAGGAPVHMLPTDVTSTEKDDNETYLIIAAIVIVILVIMIIFIVYSSVPVSTPKTDSKAGSAVINDMIRGRDMMTPQSGNNFGGYSSASVIDPGSKMGGPYSYVPEII